MTSAPTRVTAAAVPLSDRTLPDLPPEVSVPTFLGCVQRGLSTLDRSGPREVLQEFLGRVQDA